MVPRPCFCGQMKIVRCLHVVASAVVLLAADLVLGTEVHLKASLLCVAGMRG